LSVVAALAGCAGCFAVAGGVGELADADAGAEDVADADDVAEGACAALAALLVPGLGLLAPSAGVAAVEAGPSGVGALDADRVAGALAGAAVLLAATAGVATA
jgi:hypothetical protein